MAENPGLVRERVGEATLLTLPEPSLPLVRFAFVLRHGSLVDPAGKAGCTRVMLELLMRGTQRQSRTDWNRALERLGSQISTSVASELTLVHGIALKRNLVATLDLVAEALLEPALDDEERGDLIGELVDYLHSERDSDDAIADVFWRRALYPGHPLWRRPAGEPNELVTITIADVCTAYKAQWRAADLIVGMSGDVTPDEAQEFMQPIVQRFAPGYPSSAVLPPPPEPEGLTILVVDKPERTQVQLNVGRSAASGSDPDAYAFWLGIVAFGGTFTSQFTREVRDVRGWSYTASADFGRRRPYPSPMVLHTAPAVQDAVACLELELKLYRDLAQGVLEPGAVDFARTYLLNRYPLEIATRVDLLLPAVRNELLGFAPDELFAVQDKLRRITGDEVTAALKHHLHPERIAVVMVATAAVLVPSLEKKFPDAKITVVDYRDGLATATT